GSWGGHRGGRGASAPAWPRLGSAAHPARRGRVDPGDHPRAAHRLVPHAGVHAGRPDRHAVGRPAHRVGAVLRPRHRGHAVLRVEVPPAARPGAARRPADPRQHAPGGHLDADPGDHHPRPVHLRLRGARGHRGGAGLRDAHQRRRPAVHLDVRVPAARQRPAGAHDPALPAREPAGAVLHPLRGRHPRLLDPVLPHEDRRGPRRDDRLPRDAQPARQLPGRLRRAVRARPRLHAPDRPRRQPGGLRRPDPQAALRRRLRRGVQRTRPGRPGRRPGQRRQGGLHRAGLRRLPRPGRRRHRRHVGPGARRVAAERVGRRDPPIDRRAERRDHRGLPGEHHAPVQGPDPARAARRAGRLPRGDHAM
ncbi:MAG: Cytochrome c oxidase polypeptide II, partial [uncultured Solirubrobacteraceae bacterium]